jgi:XRE family aerobic/anaerobic benzoate catabolism transcriptional regulator
MILNGRSEFYAKADMVLDTSAQPLEESFQILRSRLRAVMHMPFAPNRICPIQPGD